MPMTICGDRMPMPMVIGPRLMRAMLYTDGMVRVQLVCNVSCSTDSAVERSDCRSMGLQRTLDADCTIFKRYAPCPHWPRPSPILIREAVGQNPHAGGVMSEGMIWGYLASKICWRRRTRCRLRATSLRPSQKHVGPHVWLAKTRPRPVPSPGCCLLYLVHMELEADPAMCAPSLTHSRPPWLQNSCNPPSKPVRSSTETSPKGSACHVQPLMPTSHHSAHSPPGSLSRHSGVDLSNSMELHLPGSE